MEEKSKAAELLASKVAPKNVAKNINKAREERGKNGTLIPKDIFNFQTSLKIEKRNGKTEEEILKELLENLRDKDPGGIYHLEGNIKTYFELLTF